MMAFPSSVVVISDFSTSWLSCSIFVYTNEINMKKAKQKQHNNKQMKKNHTQNPAIYIYQMTFHKITFKLLLINASFLSRTSKLKYRECSTKQTPEITIGLD